MGVICDLGFRSEFENHWCKLTATQVFNFYPSSFELVVSRRVDKRLLATIAKSIHWQIHWLWMHDAYSRLSFFVFYVESWRKKDLFGGGTNFLKLIISHFCFRTNLKNFSHWRSPFWKWQFSIFLPKQIWWPFLVINFLKVMNFQFFLKTNFLINGLKYMGANNSLEGASALKIFYYYIYVVGMWRI